MKCINQNNKLNQLKNNIRNDFDKANNMKWDIKLKLGLNQKKTIDWTEANHWCSVVKTNWIECENNEKKKHIADISLRLLWTSAEFKQQRKNKWINKCDGGNGQMDIQQYLTKWMQCLSSLFVYSICKSYQMVYLSVQASMLCCFNTKNTNWRCD